MKPTTQQVALILGLVAAVLVAYRFVGPAATAVVGIATTIVAWLVTSPKDNPQ